MASEALTFLTMVLAGVIFIRLFTYQRKGASYRWGKSAIAVVMMIACGRLVIQALTGDLIVPPQFWPFVVLLAVFAMAIVRAGGNVACLVRPDDLPWSGADRRHGGGR